MIEDDWYLVDFAKAVKISWVKKVWDMNYYKVD